MRRQQGYSLLELAIALAVLSLVVGVLFRFSGLSVQYTASELERDLLRAADSALIGFVLSNHRLPCPDNNADGNEDCTPAAGVGGLPYRTLGLPDARAATMRYGVYRNRNASSAAADADLGIVLDRMPLLEVSGVPLGARQSFAGNRNGIDFCAALRVGSLSTFSSSYVHATGSGGNRNVAFAVALPGTADAANSGQLLDGVHNGASTAFETASRVGSRTYDDRVVASSFDRLWGELSCGEMLAAVNHAHANAASSAEVLEQAIADYKEQLDLAKRLADSSLAGAVASEAAAIGGVALAAAEAALGVAQTILTTGAAAAVVGLAAAAVALSAVGLGLSTVALAMAVISQQSATADVAQFLSDGFVVRSVALATRLRANAEAADAAGLY